MILLSPSTSPIVKSIGFLGDDLGLNNPVAAVLAFGGAVLSVSRLDCSNSFVFVTRGVNDLLSLNHLSAFAAVTSLGYSVFCAGDVCARIDVNDKAAAVRTQFALGKFDVIFLA